MTVWKTYILPGLGVLGVGEAVVYLRALWDTRGACLGLEHLLEALIRLVTGGLMYHLIPILAVLTVYLFLRRYKALKKEQET